MYKKPYVLCAALHYDDDKVYPHQPRNIQSGIVVCGLRHCSCFAVFGGLLGIGNYNKGKIKQGFLTSTGMFVDRVEGLAIAKAAEQVSGGGKELLFSEDLY